jgi:hypothetical protein
VSAPAQRPSQQTTSAAGNAAVAAAAGVQGILKIVFALFAVLVIGVASWGYQRAHTPEFKTECAAYQAHIVPMSFPDNALCLIFWNLS